MSGATQVILAIFLPVWVDAFAPVEKKTRWMTLIITAAPMGLLAGYGMSAVVISTSDEWWWAFYLIIIFIIVKTSSTAAAAHWPFSRSGASKSSISSLSISSS